MRAPAVPAAGEGVLACATLGSTLGSLVEWGGGDQLGSGSLGPAAATAGTHGFHISRELRLDGLDTPGQPISPLRENIRDPLRDPLRDRVPPQATERGPDSLSVQQQQQQHQLQQQLLGGKLELLVDLHGDMNDRQSQSKWFGKRTSHYLSIPKTHLYLNFLL